MVRLCLVCNMQACIGMLYFDVPFPGKTGHDRSKNHLIFLFIPSDYTCVMLTKSKRYKKYFFGADNLLYKGSPPSDWGC